MKNTTVFSDYDPRLREYIAQAASSHPANPDPQFNELAQELFQLQFQHNPIYRTFCQRRGVTPEKIRHWREIPALPSSAFKEVDLTVLRRESRTRVFHSSGTTDRSPSRHFHDAESLALYEHSLLPWFQRHLLPDRDIMRMLLLTPESEAVPHSSLAHMGEVVKRTFGSTGSIVAGVAPASGSSWSVDCKRAASFLEKSIRSNEPVLIFGTAFSFVHWLDFMSAQGLEFRLPAGSRAMETGGYKGRSRVLAKVDLHHYLTARLGIPDSHIVCEYGMSELSSQAYDRIAAITGLRSFQFPPWAQVRVISPETGNDVADGETGLIQILDLANARSAMCVVTEDLGIKRGNGFELAGRAALSEERGCSLMTIA